jgi:hypothetical protein
MADGDDSSVSRGLNSPRAGEILAKRPVAARSSEPEDASARQEPGGSRKEGVGLRTNERPLIVDYGSIAEHTFTRCPPADPGAPPKDFTVCPEDKFDECSCPSVTISP